MDTVGTLMDTVGTLIKTIRERDRALRGYNKKLWELRPQIEAKIDLVKDFLRGLPSYSLHDHSCFIRAHVQRNDEGPGHYARWARCSIAVFVPGYYLEAIGENCRGDRTKQTLWVVISVDCKDRWTFNMGEEEKLVKELGRELAIRNFG